MTEKTLSRAKSLRLQGGLTLLPVLSEVMPGDPALMDRLASEFAPDAAKLATQKTYWLAFNGWITNRLTQEIMEGKASAKDIGPYAWAVFATAYWGGMELRENWGMPPAMDRLGIKIAAPFTDVQKGVAATLTDRLRVLDGGDDNCLHILPTLMHDDSPLGIIWNIAYNAGCQVVKTEDPPIGQRRPMRKPQPAAVRINTRDFMRVDYDMPSPMYLKVWRSAFERAVTSHPDLYEGNIVGESGQKDMRDIWKRGVVFGNKTWGGGANDMWTDAYYQDTLHWSTVVNFGLEAVGLAGFVALVNQDLTAARYAVMGNAIYAGMANGWLMGMLDIGGKLPKVVTA